MRHRFIQWLYLGETNGHFWINSCKLCCYISTHFYSWVWLFNDKLWELIILNAMEWTVFLDTYICCDHPYNYKVTNELLISLMSVFCYFNINFLIDTLWKKLNSWEPIRKIKLFIICVFALWILPTTYSNTVNQIARGLRIVKILRKLSLGSALQANSVHFHLSSCSKFYKSRIIR